MLDNSRQAPLYADGDPRQVLSREAKLRIDDAYFQQQAIRDEALAIIEGRLRGRDWDDAAFEKWSAAKIEAAYTVLSAYVREFRAIGKRGAELRNIIGGQLEAAAYSLELSGLERGTVLSRLYLLKPTHGEKVVEIPGPKPVSHKPEFPNRAAWLRSCLKERGWNAYRLHENGGPTDKTTNKILEGRGVTESTLEDVVAGLNKHRVAANVSLRDVPID